MTKLLKSTEPEFLNEPIIHLTAQIVSAHLSNNPIAPQQLPDIIRAVQKSVFPDHIVCLDCGGSFKLLKRHLAAVHEMVPEEYRQKWGLPPSYLVVAPEYAAKRTHLAKTTGWV